MKVLLKLALILVSSILSLVSFIILLPFLASLNLLHDMGGHGMGNIGYLFYGATTGFVLGLIVSGFIVIKKKELIPVFFKIQVGLTILIIIVVVTAVNFLGVSW